MEHKKDILEYLQCMVNTETPTPPKIVNDMLDLIPESVWLDDNATILCPACKDGIFLREATLRILRKKYEQMGPNEFRKHQDEIVDHILRNRMFGIAISYRGYRVTKRSLYTCSNKFADIDNIFFDESLGRYVRDKDGNETEIQCFHFIENQSEISKFFESKGVKNMHFDVIIGNPPYQESDGGAGASASPLYNKFIEQAKNISPKFLSMIIPSRWVAGGKGLNDFRKDMLNDTKIKILHDFTDPKEIFPLNDIKGGVMYFLWSKEYDGLCEITVHDPNNKTTKTTRHLNTNGVFVRYPELLSIYDKVSSFKQKSFSDIVSVRKPYGFCTDFFQNPQKYNLPPLSEHPIQDGLKILGLLKLKRTTRFVSNSYPVPIGQESINKWKIFIPNACGCGGIGGVPTPILGQPVIGAPKDICTETFLMLGPFDDQIKAENALGYLKTKFFRTLVGIKKISQHTSKDTYSFVPIQDFSEKWNDEKLYKKYNLTKEEITFIESMIKPMDETTDSSEEFTESDYINE